MNSFVNFQIFRSSKEFSTASEGAGEGFLSSMDPDMIHQLILGLEGFLLARAVLPVTGIVGHLNIIFDIILSKNTIRCILKIMQSILITILSELWEEY